MSTPFDRATPTAAIASASAPPVAPGPGMDELGAAERERLITESVGIVGHMVHEIAARVPRSVDRGDLTSAGLEALTRAAQTFDPSRGVAFSAYARLRIRGALLDELRSYDWAPRSVRRTARDIEKVRTRMATALGQLPATTEVAQALGVDPGIVTRSDQDLARATISSIDAEYGAPTAHLPSRSSGPEEALERHEQIELIADAIDELPPRLRLVVRGYFIEDRAMADIATELGVTESRVSQLRAEAMVLLRTVLNTLHDETLLVPATRETGAAARRRNNYVDLVARRHAARKTAPARPQRYLDQIPRAN